ncbi:hypothetical protein BY458DRAFT_488752 [Sporodiniella umbellata]|nr:hypothetical protein BY458DRAFT_488752 [Sporodiniella umbellata]
MYSLDFASSVSKLCMKEILLRGLNERKILRKSVPNSALLLQVFQKQQCTTRDLQSVSIHSVATLMQDTLWCCQEHIMNRKVWKDIQYETCTLIELSRFISLEGLALLTDILDFLIEVKRYKNLNLMGAHHLGEAMGKATLAPKGCDPIMADKASHFLTRLIIERAQSRSMSHQEATRAKARSYHRLIRNVRQRNYDWLPIVEVSLVAMLEDKYESDSVYCPQEPYLSIFNNPNSKDRAMSPTLYRLLTTFPEKTVYTSPQDAFKRNRKMEVNIRLTFDDFLPLLKPIHDVEIKCSLKKPKKICLKKFSGPPKKEGTESLTKKSNQVKVMMKKMIKTNHNKIRSII